MALVLRRGFVRASDKAAAGKLTAVARSGISLTDGSVIRRHRAGQVLSKTLSKASIVSRAARRAAERAASGDEGPARHISSPRDRRRPRRDLLADSSTGRRARSTRMRMVHTHGWVRRKVKNSDKWVRRWLEVNKHVLYSYQSCPADMPSARVMNMLDLRVQAHDRRRRRSRPPLRHRAAVRGRCAPGLPDEGGVAGSGARLGRG